MKVVILDYGMGNVRSVVSTLKYLGVNDILISGEFSKLKNADKLILPGVGAFGKAMERIHEKKIDQYLQELVIEKNIPILGICLGMQLLGLSSTEDGLNSGLGFIKGNVIKFDNTEIKVPHVGFNQVKTYPGSKLYEGIVNDCDFYFTHSYRMLSDDNINQSICDYGGEFIASFEKGNVAGVQFHPELSQYNGLKLLKNFLEKFNA